MSNHHGPQNATEVVKHLAGRAMDARALSLMTAFGPPGSGKSEGMIIMGSEVQKKMGGHPIRARELLNQLRFKPYEFPVMAQAAGERKSVFCDEGTGEGANKMRQMGKANVEVGIDLDACRGRKQPIFWSGPFRNDLSPQVRKHTTWVVEFTLDHAATFWEADQVDPLFGKEPYLRERFVVDPFPWLETYAPDVRAFYLDMKFDHMGGKDLQASVKVQQQLTHYEAAIRRVLG